MARRESRKMEGSTMDLMKLEVKRFMTLVFAPTNVNSNVLHLPNIASC